MTTENQPARMGDADELALRVACMPQLREVERQYPDTGKAIRDYLTFVVNERMRLWEEARARELSAHGGDGGGVDVSDIPFDTVRKVVSALTWLGHSTPESQEEQAARSVELVNTLCREVLALATQQPASGEHGPIGDAELDAAREPNPLYAAHGGSGEVAPGILECSNCESIDDSARPGCPECMGIEDLCQRLAEHGAKSGRRAATKQYSDGVPTHTEMLMGQAIDAIRRLSDPAYAKVISSQDGLLGRSSTSPIRTRGPGDTGQSDPEFDFDEPTGHCESGDPNCGPVEHWDSEGVPLCQACWESCSPFNLPGPKGFDPTPPSSASEAEVGAVPPLPEPALTEQAEYLSDKYISYFTIDQMHAYAKSYLTRSPARVGGVTDAMVEAACKAAYVVPTDFARKDMRAALEAALSQQAQP